MRWRCWMQLLAIELLLASGLAYGQVWDFAEVKAETVGFSAERLQRLDNAMQGFVQQKEFAGMITIVARHGKIVNFKVYGNQDLESGKPMPKDAIFRIYSMTKPITGVAMMLLFEEGKWDPQDPLSKHIPEFASLKVFAGTDKDGNPILLEPNHPPTIRELMTHTAGFTYGVFGTTPVDKMYQKENPLQSASLQDFMAKMARLPLLYQPGDGWTYSVSVDIQGYLIEKLSGKSLPVFMRERIFEPLGMKDTGFSVPEDKLSRLAKIYATDPKSSGLKPQPRDPNITKTPGLASGGGGLYSTATDYLRFGQMLLNNGELNGVRILAPSSVALMRANHLPQQLMTGKFGIGLQNLRPGFGFGYDVAVFEDPAKAGSTVGKGSYLWDGAAGTWFMIDPTNDIVLIGMVQRMMGPEMPNVETLSRALVYQALTDPTK